MQYTYVSHTHVSIILGIHYHLQFAENDKQRSALMQLITAVEDITWSKKEPLFPRKRL